MEQQSLQLAAFLLSVSNVVLVVQDNLEVRPYVGFGTSEALLFLQFGSYFIHDNNLGVRRSSFQFCALIVVVQDITEVRRRVCADLTTFQTLHFRLHFQHC